MNQVGMYDILAVRNGDVRHNCLNTFREEFAKFENQVWNVSSLRPSEAFTIDRKIPSLLIECFAKLIRLWKDFAVLQNVIQAEQLHRIRDDLNECFGQDISHFEVVCDTCDEKVRLERNNLKYSYNLHAQTARHQEALQNLSDVGCFSREEQVDLEETSLVHNADTFNGYIVLEKDNSLSCSLCNQKLSTEVDAIHHVTSWQHLLQEMPYNYTDRDYIVELDGVYCCRLCRCKLPEKQDNQLEHLRGRSHRLQEKCCEVLRENEPYIVLLKHEDCEFRCEPCDVTDSGWVNLVRHSEMVEHCTRLRSMRSKSETGKRDTAARRSVGSDSRPETGKRDTTPRRSADIDSRPVEDFILCLKDRYECTLCECELPFWEIAAHKREETHLQRRNEVLNGGDDAPSPFSNSRSPNSDSEPEFSKMLKDNDFFIELNLAADGTEAYKCLLCSKTGKGIDNIESHCLTEQHRSLKSHFENLSQTIAKAAVNEDDESIELVDDVYFCHLCDVLFENPVDMMNHEKCKQHVMNEQVRKLLRANGACVTKLRDDPKTYLCNLCSKELDSDGNLVSHCKSSKHKALLEVVLMLSKMF